jgi:hypothetical protein
MFNPFNLNHMTNKFQIMHIIITLGVLKFAYSQEKLIDDFEKPGIWSWWKSAVYKIEQIDGALKVTFTNAGDPKIDNGYNCFGRDHAAEPIDFTKFNTVKVRLKLQAETPTKIRLDLKDVDDRVTNANPIIKTIEPSNEWQDLYFIFTKDKFKQSWPGIDKVDPEEIKEFIIFINPGNHAKPISGVLYIDEFKLLRDDKVPADKK